MKATRIIIDGREWHVNKAGREFPGIGRAAIVSAAQVKPAWSLSELRLHAAQVHAEGRRRQKANAVQPTVRSCVDGLARMRG